MMLVLHLWQRTWQSVSFDTTRGRGTIRWLRCAPSRTIGWATKHEGTWFALGSDGKQLAFQVNERRFPMSKTQECDNTRVGSTRHFSIRDSGHVIFQQDYKAVDRDHDPTFDMVDLEQEDFFFFVFQLWRQPAWQEKIIKAWTP